MLDISQEELDEEANNIMAQGDPVAAFLASDEFRSVDPDTEEVCAIYNSIKTYRIIAIYSGD